MPKSTKENSETRLGIFMKASMIETEHRLAKVHVLIGMLGCAVSVLLVSNEMLPLIMPGWLYLSGLFFFLILATFYLTWAPYRKYDLRIAAAAITILDLLTATLIILNTGGLLSTFWGLWAAVALTFIIRFHISWGNWVTLFILLVITVILAITLASDRIISVDGAIVGIVFSLMAILLSGYILVRKEREAIQLGMMQESEAIHRLVNTIQHEVNNPLTVVSGNLMLLQKDKTEEEQAARIGKIRNALNQIGNAIEQLRDLEEVRLVSGIGLVERYPLKKEREAIDKDEGSQV